MPKSTLHRKLDTKTRILIEKIKKAQQDPAFQREVKQFIANHTTGNQLNQ